MLSQLNSATLMEDYARINMGLDYTANQQPPSVLSSPTSVLASVIIASPQLGVGARGGISITRTDDTRCVMPLISLDVSHLAPNVI